MIALRNLALARGTKRLFADANLAFFASQRIGVVGANGCGKSSLFALLLGELHPDRGDAVIQSGAVIAHVSQETPTTQQAAIEYVLDGDVELREAELELQLADAAQDGERIALAHERYDLLGGWEARSRAAILLAGLGVSGPDQAKPVAALSGGLRMRLNLARALMRRSDILLLDEPTNHLDLDAVLWLEDWLSGYRGLMFLISHDREFLDGTANRILHFERGETAGRLRLYTGNYTQFEQQRASMLEQQSAAHAAQTRRVAELERFIERFRAKASKARQAQSRVKALERLERIAPAHVDSEFQLRFREFPGGPERALEIEDVAVSYGATPVLTGVRLTVRAGMRLGVLGRNGAGKSTLVRMLAGRLAPASGERREGKGLRIGYFDQHQMDSVDPDASPLDQLKRRDPRAREQDLRSFLGGFGFPGDIAVEPSTGFSGGERARLALALIIWDRPNLLLLDEPTNHLDIDMREALVEALQEYEGALVLVSHDRHLLRTCSDELVLVRNGRVEEFDGDLEDYRDALRQSPSTSQTATRSGDGNNDAPSEERGRGENRQEVRRREAEVRQAQAARRKPLSQRLAKIEAELAELQAEARVLGARLADEAFYRGAPPDEVAAALKEQAAIARREARAEAEWMDVAQQLENLDRAP